MTDTPIPQERAYAAIESAAKLLAEQLGLGDEARATDDWPIDRGTPVLRVVFGGGADGMLALAVNDDVADRLQSNPSLLERAFGAAVQRIAELGELELTPASVDREPILDPIAAAMVMDAGSLTAVVGLAFGVDELVLAGVAASPAAAVAGPQPNAPVYEPAHLDGGTPSHQSHAVGAPSGLSMLHDVDLLVTAELGRTVMPVRDVLNLSPGMVVEIDRIAGSPIDLLVNGRRIATGEVVVIDEEFGIRITEIIPTGDPR